MKKACITLSVLLFTITLFAQKADFSGKWKINLVKSDYGDTPPNSLAAKLNIVQDEIELRIERLWVKEDKETGYTEKFSKDTAEYVRKLKDDGKMVSNIKWSNDGKTLTEVMKVMSGDEVSQTITQVNTLLDNGKTLKLEQTVSAGGQDFKMVVIYEK